MATSGETDGQEASENTDNVIVSSGTENDVTSHARGNVHVPVSACQGACDITIDKERSEYVSTPALDEADDMLQRTGWVILCGTPGCGKTTLAYALSRRSRDQGFAPYALENLEQLKPQVAKSQSSVVVLDGVLGEVRVQSQQRDHWKLIQDTILMLRVEGACRFVITVYPHVLRELQQLEKDDGGPLLDDSAVIWLTDSLPEGVKETLLNFHLDKLHLEADKKLQVLKDILKNDASGPVFPWCCDYMVKQWDVAHDPTNIFLAPAKAYTKLLKEMVLDHSHGSAFAALFSLTMKAMSFFLHHPANTETRLKELGLEPISADQLAAYAHVLQGSILSEGAFSCRALYEAAGIVLGQYFRFPVLMSVCDTPFLVQYVDIQTVNAGVSKDLPSDTCVAVGSAPINSKDPKQSTEDLQALVKRIYTEIVQSNLQLICQHPCLQCPQFLQGLVDYCAGNGLKLKKLLKVVDSVHPLPLVYWSAFLPSPNLTHWCLLVMQADRKLSTKVWMACSLFDNITHSSEHKLQSFLHETVTAQHFEHSECTMEFPLLGKDQCLKREMQKQIEILTETASTPGRLLYLLDPSLPIPPDVVMLQMTGGKLRLRIKDQSLWYLVFRLLTDREASETDSDGSSLLHVVISCGQFTVVRLCLKAGAVITQQNRQGVTPYQMTRRTRSQLPKTRETGRTDQIFRRFPDLDLAEVQLLLLQELSVEDRDSDGRTGLLVACREGRGDIADLYIDLGAEVNVKDTLQDTDHCTPLHYACKNGLVHTVERLIQHKADVTTTTKDGLTALHFATLNSSHTALADIARVLVLNNGIDVKIQLRQSDTLLHLFALKGYSDAAQLLIHHGADVNSQNTKGRSPLHCAATQGHSDTAELLIRHDADVNTRDENKHTSLHCTALHGHTDTAELLIRHGADVNRPDKKGWTSLHCAVLQGHSDTAELLIHHSADVNTQNVKGQTPLHLAALQGHSDTADLLIRHDADVNTKNKGGWSQLHCAAIQGHSDTVGLLIRHDADVNSQDKDGGTPLHLAAILDHADTAELLINHDADVSTQDKDGGTPLHCAALQGHSDTAEVLVFHGADVNTQNRNRWTPLHLAAQEGHSDTAELLIFHDADVNAQTEGGWTPLHFAAQKGVSEVTELLMSHGADVNRQNKRGETPLHAAAKEGLSNMVELLLRHGADVNTQNKGGWTPLHFTAVQDHADTAELLIRHNAKIKKQDKEGNTPLHLAALQGHPVTTERLMHHGANINEQNKKGWTPLHSAVLHNRSVVAELLLRQGADVNARDQKGWTLLHSAAVHGHSDTVEVLLFHGADVNSQNKRGWTALHFAALEGYQATAEMLVRYGADVNAQDKEGWTPLHCAALNGHSDTAQLLIRHNADVNTQYKKGWTPLHYAVKGGHSDTVEVLKRHGAQETR